MKKTFIIFLSLVILLGCSSTAKVYMENYPGVLDFGYISGIDPEVIDDAETRSTTYAYRFIGENIDERYFVQFYKNLDKEGYNKIIDDRLNDNGTISKLLENDKYQIMTVETFDSVGKNKKHINDFIVSIREKYATYSDYPTVPDYGVLNGIEPNNITEEEGVKAHIYENSVQTEEYVRILKLLGFEMLEDRITYETGGMTVYGDDTYYVIVGDFPTLTLITVGKH